jgi:hypothetical protein
LSRKKKTIKFIFPNQGFKKQSVSGKMQRQNRIGSHRYRFSPFYIVKKKIKLKHRYNSDEMPLLPRQNVNRQIIPKKFQLK